MGLSAGGTHICPIELAFCVATLLIEGDVFVEQFTTDCVDDIDRIALSRKIKVFHDPDITKRGSGYRHMVRVEVEFEDGDIESETREYPRGSEYDFASDERRSFANLRHWRKAL